MWWLDPCGDYSVVYTNSKSLCHILEANIMSYANYTSIKKKRMYIHSLYLGYHRFSSKVFPKPNEINEWSLGSRVSFKEAAVQW